MPEIKHNFTSGKMNKDLDERLVQNGEYRDALNIQVRTTDGAGSGIGEAGTAQNIQGNTNIAEAYLTKGYEYTEDWNTTRFVGSVADEKTDKAYFFAAAPTPESDKGWLTEIINPITALNLISSDQIDEDDFPNAQWITDYQEVLPGMNGPGNFDSNDNYWDAYAQSIYSGDTKKHWIDSIIEVDAKIEEGEHIFVDKFAVTGRWIDVMGVALPSIVGPGSGVNQITVTNGSHYRVGMIVRFFNDGNQDLFFENGVDSSDGVGVEIVNIQGNVLSFATPQQVNINGLASMTNPTVTWKSAFVFEYRERVLQFNPFRLISSINIIDKLLFWTDGFTEPKKINIERSKEGTEPVSNIEPVPKHTKLTVYDNEENEPDLVEVMDMEWSLKTSDIKREHVTVIRRAPISAPTLEMRDTDRLGDISFSIVNNFIDGENYTPAVPQAGDTRIIDFDINPDIRVGDILIFTSANNTLDPVIITARVKIITDDAVEGYVHFEILYVDPELSIYNPQEWNVELQQQKALFETKFGRVGYRYKYEDGEYSSFSPWSELAFLPGEFSYTPSQGFNNGMENQLRYLAIKDFIPDDSIRPNDVRSIDLLWKTTDDQNVYIIKSISRGRSREWKDFDAEELETTGKVIVTSEMIHKVLSSNQLFRAWDNVPKTAVTQEITANRLVYGNYKQGYDISKDVGLIQNIISSPVTFPFPRKSVKSIRKYKWGIVLGDKYGRETSVLVDGYESGNNEVITGDITVDKSLAHLKNKFQLQQDWGFSPGNILYWAEYVKYYVKETSNEYYSLVLDRWYDAGDGNIWLAFPSVDRNKIDEETYLILKNQHGSQKPVEVEARYKVLAIASEAPDHVKTRYNKFERVEIDQFGVYGVGENGTDLEPNESTGEITDGIPSNLIGKIKIRTTKTLWDDVDIDNNNFKGNKKVRIVGVNEYYSVEAFSPWRDVSRIKRAWQAGARSGCDLPYPFESGEVNMYTKISAMLPPGEIISQTSVDDGPWDDNPGSNSYIKYYMEFRDEVVENRPQFDGRFFVKIEKDDILTEQVLNQAGANGVDYVVDVDAGVAVYEIAYIDNRTTNPGVGGGFGGDNWESYMETNGFSDSLIGYVTPPIPLPWNPGDSQPSSFYNYPLWGSTQTNPWSMDGYWGDVAMNVAANFTSDGVPWFGPGGPVDTENFWYWWLEQGEGDSPARTASIFLDSAPAFAAFHWWGKVYAEYTSMEGGFSEYQPRYYPTALSHFDCDIISNYVGNPSLVNFGDTYLNSNGVYDASLNGTGIYGNDSGFWPGYRDGNAVIDGDYYPENFKSTLNYNPPGLSQGKAIDGELGQMCFSMINIEPGAFGFGPEGLFKAKMQTPGTFFRFVEDPYQTVYKVTEIDEPTPNYQQTGIQDDDGDGFPQGIDYTEYANMKGPISIDSINFPDNDTSNLVRNRHSIIVQFARVEDNVQIPGSGIKTDSWDPRGAVKHNGLGSFSIEFLLKANEGELASDEVITEGACWETEPKEDIDVDIYYEASNAIPMKLKQNNIKLYVDPSSDRAEASTINIQSRTLSSTDINGNAIIEPVNLNGYYKINNYSTVSAFGGDGGNTYVYRTISDDVINIKGGTLNYDFQYLATPIGYDTDSPWSMWGIAIGDIISFTHTDGTITRSKILDHVLPIDSTSTYAWDLTSQDYTALNSFDTYTPTDRYTLTDATSIDTITNPNHPIINFPSNQLDDFFAIGGNNIQVGMEVIGNGVEKGTFVKEVDIANFGIYEPPHKIHLSKPLVSTALPNDFTFISVTGWYQIDRDVWRYPVDLPWFNCYSFGNGVESDRIRDDFNAPQINNGVKASSTFLEYGEERMGSGLIHSSELYNATSSINGLNEFSMAQKITKNLNPIYGSIQALKTRDTDVVVLAEDKILKVLANKDAVYNADGNMQLTATDNVLGQTIPFVGDYGISKNPESLAWDQYRIYFADKQRGAVLRLSRDGLTPISNVGMKTYFREFMPKCDNLVGTFDVVSGEYNLKLGTNEINETEMVCTPAGCNVAAQPITVTFNEGSKGWVSFKSFMHSCGVSVTGKYITAPTNKHSNTHKIWKHHDKDVGRNNFYGSGNASTIDILFNDLPSTVKSFKTINYEGSRARVNVSLQDNNYYNLQSSSGWYVSSIITDLQSGSVPEFIKKESKFFNYIVGEETTYDNMDTSDISVLGIGYPIQIGATTDDSTTSVSNIQTGTISIGGEPDLGSTESGGEVVTGGGSEEGSEGVVVGNDPNTEETQEDVDTEIEIEETESEDSLPTINEVGFMTAYNNEDGENKGTFLFKVSGGSGNYVFRLHARYANGINMPTPFPNGINYSANTWDDTEINQVNNFWWTDQLLSTGEMQVPDDFDWSYGEWDFAAHIQFPTGLSLDPYGLGIDGVEYKLWIYDAANSYDVENPDGSISNWPVPVYLDDDGLPSILAPSFPSGPQTYFTFSDLIDPPNGPNQLGVGDDALQIDGIPLANLDNISNFPATEEEDPDFAQVKFTINFQEAYPQTDDNGVATGEFQNYFNVDIDTINGQILGAMNMYLQENNIQINLSGGNLDGNETLSNGISSFGSAEAWLVPGDYMWSFNTAGAGTPWVFVQFTITDDPSVYPQTIISTPVTLQELI